MSPKLQQKNCNLVAAIFEFFGLGGGLKFEYSSARDLEIEPVSVSYVKLLNFRRR